MAYNEFNPYRDRVKEPVLVEELKLCQYATLHYGTNQQSTVITPLMILTTLCLLERTNKDQHVVDTSKP